MLNTTLYKNKAFKDQVKACFKKTFGKYNNSHINSILQKQNTGVLTLVIFNELGNINPRKMLKLLSCVIYTIIDRYVCIYCTNQHFEHFPWIDITKLIKTSNVSTLVFSFINIVLI